MSEPSCFNPRPRVGANGAGGFAVRGVLPVSIHAPVWGRTFSASVLTTSPLEFQSTPPCGGERRLSHRSSRRRTFQSTPPCGSELDRRPSERSECEVSIHAPVWGRTLYAANVAWKNALVSIHAPVWGRTAYPWSPAQWTKGFNPRPRVGANAYRSLAVRHSHAVSIHAPVWGRTVGPDVVVHPCQVSIHAPVWGRTTVTFDDTAAWTGVSIHAPVWGRTGLSVATLDATTFQSTPPCGGERR